MKKLFCGLVMAASLVGKSGATDEASVRVTVKEEKTASVQICHYQVTNQSHQPLITFGVGSGPSGDGPYEILSAPVSTRAPGGWAAHGTSEGQPPSGYAVDWQAEEYQNGIMPGGMLAGFEVILPSTPTMSCAGIHWKTVTRDSNVLFGLL